MSINIVSVTKDSDITITPDISTSTLYDAGQVFSIAAPTGYKISEIQYGLSTAIPDTISAANVNLSPLLPYVSVVPNASPIQFTLPPQTVSGATQRYKIVIKKKLVKVYFKTVVVDKTTNVPAISVGTLYDAGTAFTITAPTGKKINTITFYDASENSTEDDIMTETSSATCNFKNNVSDYPLCDSTILTLPTDEGKAYTIMVDIVDQTIYTIKTQLERCITEIEYRALTSGKFDNRYLFPVATQIGNNRYGWGQSRGTLTPSRYYTYNDLAEIKLSPENTNGWKFMIGKGKAAVWAYDFGGIFEPPKGYLPKFLGPFNFFASLSRAPAPYTTWLFSFTFLMGIIIFNISHNGKFICSLEASTSEGPDQPLQVREKIYPPTWDFRKIILRAATTMGTNPSRPEYVMVMGTKEWGEGGMEPYIKHRYVTDEMIEEAIANNVELSTPVTLEPINGVDYSDGIYISPIPETVTGMAGKYYEKQVNTDDCDVVTWEIASQDIPGDPLTINATGFVSGMIPLTVPPGDYIVVVKATNSVGSVRFLTLSITVSEYDVSDTWEVLGSSPIEVNHILYHSGDFCLLAGTRYVYKTTDFVNYTKVYDGGTTSRHMSRMYELSDGTVLMGFGRANSNNTYTDTYTLLSDATVTAFTERILYVGYGVFIDLCLAADPLYAFASVAQSGGTRLAKVLISTGGKALDVAATDAGAGKRIASMEVIGAGTGGWEKLIFTRTGTSGVGGVNSIMSTANANTWVEEWPGESVMGIYLPVTQCFYKTTEGDWYVKNKQGIYLSTDDGDTWTLVNAGIAGDVLKPAFLMATDDLFLQAESSTTNGKVYKSTNACVNFTVNYTLTNGAKPVILYKDWKGRIMLVTTGTTNNILRAA